jgi:RNA polymerase sigma factor (sigma-70 family)
MCYAFLRRTTKLENKPLTYIVKACKNAAINNRFCGKSICSKPRERIEIVSLDRLCERIPSKKRFERNIHLKILVENLFLVLTKREKQVAMLIMEEYTEHEMGKLLCISQQRINRIKRQIRQKMKKLIHTHVVI